MKPKEIHIGTRLELELLNKNGEKVGNTYISQLLEQQEPTSLVISVPIFEARLIFIPLHSHLRLTFAHYEYGLLGFTALVTGREFRGNIAVLVVEPESELVRIQRRTHYRLDQIEDITLWPDGRDPEDDSIRCIKALTRNISGSGICVVTDISIPKNTVVDIELCLAGDVIICARCVVMRNSPFEVKKSRNYELGLHFSDISKKDRDSLIKYIFQQQRLQLKKVMKEGS